VVSRRERCVLTGLVLAVVGEGRCTRGALVSCLGKETHGGIRQLNIDLKLG
jgi:hypothetical protein